MDYENEFFSLPHSEYLEWGGKNFYKAMLLYESNVLLAEALYPVLHTVEIAFRTPINTYMIEWYGNENWLKENIPKNYIVSTALNRLNVKYGSQTYTNEAVVGELPFGFWVRIFETECIPGRNFELRKIITSDETPDKRLFKKQIKTIKDFRNDVFHHKPILRQNLKTRMEECREMLEWLCFDRLIWYDSITRLDLVYDKVKSQLERAKLEHFLV